MTKTRVCILTSGHTPFDERIFHKQAKSLAGAGYEVVIVAPHSADERVDDIKIKAVRKERGGLKGMVFTAFRVFMSGVKEKADIYHFHDPELIPFGLILKLMGKRVVYDVHEYYKQNFMSKRAIHWALRKLIAYSFDFIETFASKLYDGVIVVDRLTGLKFKGRSLKVSNYPYRPKQSLKSKPHGGDFKCVYAGGLSADRGLFKMIEAMEHVRIPAKLILLGPLSEEDRLKAEKMKGYEKVEALGLRPWLEVLRLLPEYDLGLVLLQPVPAYYYAGEGTVKLFEYMGAGLPVLGSNLPNLERIIKDEDCGVSVDPTDPIEIAKKITFFAENREAAGSMGKNGRKAVEDKYNWEMEAKKLLGLYSHFSDEGLIMSGKKSMA